jgi:hypothetical protein
LLWILTERSTLNTTTHLTKRTMRLLHVIVNVYLVNSNWNTTTTRLLWRLTMEVTWEFMTERSKFTTRELKMNCSKRPIKLPTTVWILK